VLKSTIITAGKRVTDPEKRSGKVWREIDEAAEMSAGEGAVEELAGTQQNDRVGHAATEIGGGKCKHLLKKIEKLLKLFFVIGN
jgi:hypothetical protein